MRSGCKYNQNTIQNGKRKKFSDFTVTVKFFSPRRNVDMYKKSKLEKDIFLLEENGKQMHTCVTIDGNNRQAYPSITHTITYENQTKYKFRRIDNWAFSFLLIND